MHYEGRLHAIERVLDDHHSYWLVSDEIALKKENDERVVADLLLVREDALGESEFVNVELKSQRTTETHKQVVEFSAFIQEPDRIALWREFAETMLGGKKRRWKEPGGCGGLVIWPSRSDPSTSRGSTLQLIKQYKLQGIDTICYSGSQYSFRPESPEAPAGVPAHADAGSS